MYLCEFVFVDATSLASLHPLPPGVNPDLAEERARPCGFSQTELTELIDGGRCDMQWDVRNWYLKLIDVPLQWDVQNWKLGRERTEERKRLEAIFLDGKEVENFFIFLIQFNFFNGKEVENFLYFQFNLIFLYGKEVENF